MIWLIIQSIENDEQREAVHRICDLYYRYMWKIAWNILNHQQDSEDAVQDAFCNISLHADQFLDAHDTATIALVCTYTRNAALNIYKRKKKGSELFTSVDSQECLEHVAMDEQALDTLLEDENTAELIRWAVNQLDDVHRDVILLKYFYHYRNIDIAKVLNTTPNDVNGKMFRAKKKLRKILQDKI